MVIVNNYFITTPQQLSLPNYILFICFFVIIIW